MKECLHAGVRGGQGLGRKGLGGRGHPQYTSTDVFVYISNTGLQPKVECNFPV